MDRVIPLLAPGSGALGAQDPEGLEAAAAPVDVTAQVQDGDMAMIYMPWRCYAPPGGHPGWLFEVDDTWYAGSLEMHHVDETPQWISCKWTFNSRDAALGWFGRGGSAVDRDASAPSAYCAVDSWVLDDRANATAGIAAREAAGSDAGWNWNTNNCWHEALRVLEAAAGCPPEVLAGTPREFPWSRPSGCRNECDRPTLAA